jgi:hypothetical protein
MHRANECRVLRNNAMQRIPHGGRKSASACAERAAAEAKRYAAQTLVFRRTREGLTEEC